MYAGKDFSLAAPEEARDFTFDFFRDLSTGETLTSATWSCEVVSGTDGDAASHIFGAAAITDSEESGLADVCTTQRISGLVNGVKYRLTALAVTSNTQSLELYAHVVCKTRN